MKKFVDMLKITYETKLKIVQEKLSRKSPILVTWRGQQSAWRF